MPTFCAAATAAATVASTLSVQHFKGIYFWHFMISRMHFEKEREGEKKKETVCVCPQGAILLEEKLIVNCGKNSLNLYIYSMYIYPR